MLLFLGDILMYKFILHKNRVKSKWLTIKSFVEACLFFFLLTILCIFCSKTVTALEKFLYYYHPIIPSAIYFILGILAFTSIMPINVADYNVVYFCNNVLRIPVFLGGLIGGCSMSIVYAIFATQITFLLKMEDKIQRNIAVKSKRIIVESFLLAVGGGIIRDIITLSKDFIFFSIPSVSSTLQLSDSTQKGISVVCMMLFLFAFMFIICYFLGPDNWRTWFPVKPALFSAINLIFFMTFAYLKKLYSLHFLRFIMDAQFVFTFLMLEILLVPGMNVIMFIGSYKPVVHAEFNYVINSILTLCIITTIWAVTYGGRDKIMGLTNFCYIIGLTVAIGFKINKLSNFRL